MNKITRDCHSIKIFLYFNTRRSKKKGRTLSKVDFKENNKRGIGGALMTWKRRVRNYTDDVSLRWTRERKIIMIARRWGVLKGIRAF